MATRLRRLAIGRAVFRTAAATPQLATQIDPATADPVALPVWRFAHSAHAGDGATGVHSLRAFLLVVLLSVTAAAPLGAQGAVTLDERILRFTAADGTPLE